jgi:UDPglucose--hexose-1-phosphate uridylyltransferase
MGSDAVEQILRDEVAQAFAHVLEDAGVFKWTDEGRVARDRFTDVLVAR